MKSSQVIVFVVALLALAGAGVYYTSVKGNDSSGKQVLPANVETFADQNNPNAAVETSPWRPVQDIFEELQNPNLPPDMHFYATNNRRVTFDKWKGQKLIVNLWATWCAPCIEELPDLDRLKGQVQGKGYDVIAISLDRNKSIDEVDAFLSTLKIKNLITFFDQDRSVIRNVNIKSFPLTFILNEEGLEIARFTGPLDWDDPKVLTALSKL